MLMEKQNLRQRCEWPGSNALMIEYHDKEWGTPTRDDGKLWEYFVLDTFQAGLSWQIILNKRENFRKALNNFNARRIAMYGNADITRLLKDEGIIRNKLKINGLVINARKFLEVQKEFGSFANYIWGFTGNKTMHRNVKSLKELRETSPESDKMSADLKQRGFKFVGSTICYAFMQGAGLVNDHTTSCFRYAEIRRSGRKS